MLFVPPQGKRRWNIVGINDDTMFKGALRQLCREFLSGSPAKAGRFSQPDERNDASDTAFEGILGTTESKTFLSGAFGTGQADHLH